jgi:hypothetical protein
LATILALFAGRKIPAGQAACDLGLDRVGFVELLKHRAIPNVIYTAEDWEADGKAIEELSTHRASSEVYAPQPAAE